MTLSGVVDFASLSLLLSLSRFFFLSFAKKGVCLKKRPNNVFGFFPLRTGKGAALLRTHHHRSPHLTHSTGVLKCALPKKEEGRSSLLDVFFHKKNAKFFGGFRSLVVACCAPEYKDMKKKQKNAPKKHCILHYPKLIGSLQSSKKATTTTTNGEPSTLVQSTDDHRARKPLFF